MSAPAILRLLFIAAFPLCTPLCAGSGPDREEPIRLDASRFNRADSPAGPDKTGFSLFDHDTWRLTEKFDWLKHHRLYTAGGLAGLLLLILVARKAARPELRNLPPDAVFKRLNRMFASRIGEPELEALASACAKKGFLNLPLARKLNGPQLSELLGFLYIAGSYKLYAEAVFLNKGVFDCCARPGMAYGSPRWTSIARLPGQTFVKIARWLEEHCDSAAQFQFINAVSRKLAEDGLKESAGALILSVPPNRLHRSSWETVLDVCDTLSALPPRYLEALPQSLLGRAIIRLIREGDTAEAKKLMNKLPRSSWQETDYLAYFMLETEFDPALAHEFYPVFREKVNLKSNPQIHYEAAQHCEKTGHADLAIEIYRRFITEGVAYRDAEKRYNALRGNLAVNSRSYHIMMTNMKGYSEKTCSEPAEFMMDYLKKHNDIVASLIREHKGRIVKTIGDSFLAVFESGWSAINCGMQVQKALKKHNAQKPPREAIHIRVVIHAGEVSVAADGDIYGEAVNLTARLDDMAEAGEVWITDPVYRAAQVNAALFQPEGFRNFKGINREIMVYRSNPA
ncbi:MAG: adenylate/guanylate cyclase domain-containing protein [Elusimicrobiaceae bacterium]|nr:adenylate/guanylate cyclase domain-containing protein [Elusimicrobiaceae bacterium]